MNHNLTEIVCIVDRSGSMESVRTDAMGGFNAFLASQKSLPSEARLTLVLFDHEYNLVHDGLSLQQVSPLTETTYVPRGRTALFDAIGRTIDDVGRRLAATTEAERAGKIIVAILTDGLENASTKYSQVRVADMISRQRETYAWEFVFLAANQDAILAAEQLSIDAQDAVAFPASPEGVRAAFACIDERVAGSRGR
ncbi:MAG: VWA domain-containing protein [Candidatus Sumerlaeaceae bacterium]|nr:VWA domain-containing protein [Candidatus Sumerlaeaceae bacterium]